MRIDIAAVGRLRKGPEAAMVADYLDRFAKTGRGLGLPSVRLIEVEDKRGGGMAAEAGLLTRAIPAGSAMIALDERGDQPTSPDFAARIATFRDQARDLCFVIGGADGIDPSLRSRAEWQISFGKMVWPHMLVRVMLAEQLYRATTILAGTPYHRN
ncbi:23S rRNA (pseudouridine(1915)-N(3))-methyltransferase RlmH [Paracoccus onubensis]|uniref:23S rRNA (pseudouridine(1915)-N(3))-methyltransferase RlmH n=1 Tax=Paracoccus onubensis TaxID=1675788 RepID=UPI002730A39E|nr:23S rRNA (pseudouridine(1915)-N(3))-methyltransferase RlmH [Paracoccus onubensis]MDP0925765.1 23S rRNA (pseudouridine(1915)-N(3))-methyltransferase RlmH [Paracoccus onubensis]